MPSFKVAVVDLSYSYFDHVTISLYCRTEQGQLIVIKDYHRPYFFILPRPGTDVMDLRIKLGKISINPYQKVTATSLEKKLVKGVLTPVIKVYVSSPDSVHHIATIIEAWDMVLGVFEADISITRRYLLDNNIIPYSVCDCEVVQTDETINMLPVYKLVKITSRNIGFIQPEVISIALTDSSIEHEPIISSIALVSESHHVIYSILDYGQQNTSVVFCATEADLIAHTIEYLALHKPDIILFENNHQGLKMIIDRATVYGINCAINFDGSTPFFNSMTKRFRTIGCNEIQVTKLVEHSLDMGFDSDLESVYSSVLTSVYIASIIESDSDSCAEINTVYRRACLNNQLFASLFTQCTEIFTLVGLRAADTLSLSLSTLIEWILIHKCVAINSLIPNRPSLRDTSTVSTGIYSENYQSLPQEFLIESLPGLYNPVVKGDISLLYSDSIVTLNASIDSYECNCCTTTFCKKNQGIVPLVISEIQRRIERIDEVKIQSPNPVLERKKTVLMRVRNGFYDYLFSSVYRWNSPVIIHEVTKKVHENLHKLILFFNTNNRVLNIHENYIYIHLHQELPSCIQELYEKHPDISWFSIVALYPNSLFLSCDESRANRLRAAFLEKITPESNSSISPIISSGIIRRHHPGFVKETIKLILQQILCNSSRAEIIATIQDTIHKIETYHFSPKQMEIQMRLLQSPSEYTEHTAIKTIINALQTKNIVVHKGSIIRYVIADIDGNHAEKAKLLDDMGSLKYDAKYYVHKVLIPAISEIIHVVGILPEEIISGKTQSSLSHFM